MKKPITNSLTNNAIIFATGAHGDQRRKGKGDVPYIIHPLDVFNEIMYHSGFKGKELLKSSLLALLHDVIEDTTKTEKDIFEVFGQEIMDGVLALSNEVGVEEKSKDSKLNRLEKKLKKLQAEPRWIQAVKVADRLSNLKTFPTFWTTEKISNYLSEAELISDMIGNSSKGLNARLLSRINKTRVMLSIFNS
jgi:guanosine-3',5'-bis(diphosphate) 3'-pyrophosphohydrolase